MAIENLQPTTELEATNAMLAAIGEAPIASLGSGHPDEDMATDILTEAVRQAQARRWRFNSEYNYTISTGGDDSNGYPVFEVPSNLASWDLAIVEAQRGLDVVAREERDGTPDDDAWIFADRINGTDGIEALDGGTDLMINPVWFVDFTHCPQSFRTWITILAARRFQAQAVGGNQDSEFGFTEKDEARAYALFLEDQKENIPVPPLSSTAMTELEALNQILTANGVDPVVSLSALHDQDQFLALQILRDASRETQAKGWRFNYDASYELEPADTYDWTDSEDETTTLNIFTLPTGVLTFDVTPAEGQAGAEKVDVVERDSVRYNDPNFTPVLYDRLLNRDGLEQENHEYLYLDIVWLIPWTELPESAKQYITILAARRFLATRENPRTLPWTERDEHMAFRALKKDQGNKRRRNLFDHPDNWEYLGRRTPTRFALTRSTNHR